MSLGLSNSPPDEEHIGDVASQQRFKNTAVSVTCCKMDGCVA